MNEPIGLEACLQKSKLGTNA